MPHSNPVPQPKTDEALQYVDFMTRQIGQKAAEIAELRTRIKTIRAEMQRDKRARDRVADRHGISVSDA